MIMFKTKMVIPARVIMIIIQIAVDNLTQTLLSLLISAVFVLQKIMKIMFLIQKRSVSKHARTLSLIGFKFMVRIMTFAVSTFPSKILMRLTKRNAQYSLIQCHKKLKM